jgi:hypothetical protein
MSKPFIRVLKEVIYRDEPISVGTVMAKSDLHDDSIWTNWVVMGYAVEQDNAGKLSDK